MSDKWKNIRKAKAIEATYRKKWLEIKPELNDEAGIYILYREDEDDFKYAYVGQAKHILTRLCQHSAGHDSHIDKSLKKHGLVSEKNPHGWGVVFINYPESKLDDREQYFEKYMANIGYQLRNKTSGGQGAGKKQIDEYRPPKGYRDGIQQGKRSLAKDLKHIIDTHLIVSLKPEKQNNKVSIKAFEKFKSLLDEDSYK